MSTMILLVDDDERLLAGLQRALHREPYEVVVAHDTARAFAVLETHSIAAVVSDEAMPGMLGTDFLAQVRIRYPDAMRIMLTGHASVDVAVRSINEGAVFRFLIKPCRPVELALAVREALQQRELVLKSRRLLATVRRQAAALDELEHDVRGITYVRRDASGAIVVDERPVGDLSDLLREMERELDDAERRLRPSQSAAVDPDGLSPTGQS